MGKRGLLTLDHTYYRYESVFIFCEGSNIKPRSHKHTSGVEATLGAAFPKHLDQSGDIINPEFWGKRRFTRFFLDLPHAILHHHLPLPLPAPARQTWFQVWRAGPVPARSSDGGRVQPNQKVSPPARCGVCVGVIERHGVPPRDPPLIVKWRSPRVTPGTSIKHRQATDNLPLSPSLSTFLSSSPPPSFIL